MAQAESFVDSLIAELLSHPVNTNLFFRTFLDQRLTEAQLRDWLIQYHYFCKHFVKLLEGLLYRTPVEELEMRAQLAKTLDSELGSGRSDQAHIRLLERFADALGLSPEDLRRGSPIPAVEEYLRVLHRLFTQEDLLAALGAELAVEVTAAAEFRYFHPGLLQYQRFSPDDLVFFELHLKAEEDHGHWLAEAVRGTTKCRSDRDRVAVGARTTADAWHHFWEGMHHAVFQGTTVGGAPWNC
ncbi:MAG TPA: iron-containing redox enzyme family protein [Nitrospirales bacterium]|jgi:pyrroloquinoline quinone (PQQ) biosynthesis protein C